MANAQIRTHFDSKVILAFVILFLFSLSFLIVKKNTTKACNLSEIKVEGSDHKVGNVVTFSDLSSSSDRWEWNFGDNEAIEYKSKVNHIFKQPGVFKVRLTTGDGCYLDKKITILPSNSGFDINKVPVVNYKKECFVGEAVTFTDVSNFSTSWEWRFGENNSGKVDSKSKVATYSFTKPGVKYGSLVVNGDIQHLKKIEVFVKELTKAPVVDVKANIKVNEKSKPEAESDDDILLNAVLGVADDELSYVNFSKYFCLDKMPKLLVNGKSMTLKQFDNEIRPKIIHIKSFTVVRKGECPVAININYKDKGFFSAKSSAD